MPKQKKRKAISMADRVKLVSHRQIQILRLMAAGYRRKEICKILNFTEGTLQQHKSRMRVHLKLPIQAWTGMLIRYKVKYGLPDDWEIEDYLTEEDID